MGRICKSGIVNNMMSWGLLIKCFLANPLEMISMSLSSRVAESRVDSHDLSEWPGELATVKKKRM